MRTEKYLARVSVSKLREFLSELVNTQGENAAIGRFGKKYSGWIGAEELISWARHQQDMSGETEDVLLQTAYEVCLFRMQDWVRRVWQAPDVHTARWRAFVAQFHIYDLGPSSGRNRDDEPPLPSPVHQALSYLRENADHLRRCGNPDCSAPYFFVKRRNQRYCCDACSEPAARAAKLNWWKQHGPAWRKQQKMHK